MPEKLGWVFTRSAGSAVPVAWRCLFWDMMMRVSDSTHMARYIPRRNVATAWSDRHLNILTPTIAAAHWSREPLDAHRGGVLE